MARLLKNGTVFSNAEYTPGEQPLGTIEFNGTPISPTLGVYPALFQPRKHETGDMDVEYTSTDLREIADLMDGLEKEKAAAAGK